MAGDDTPDITSPRVALTPQEPPDMTRRDWFAAMALVGLNAREDDISSPYSPERLARQAYRAADAMEAARTKEPRA